VLHSALALVALVAAINAQRAIHHEAPVRQIANLGCTEHHALACARRHGLRVGYVEVVSAVGAHSPTQALKAWLQSPPHRAIVLDPQLRVASPYRHGTSWRVLFAP